VDDIAPFITDFVNGKYPLDSEEVLLEFGTLEAAEAWKLWWREQGESVYVEHAFRAA